MTNDVYPRVINFALKYIKASRHFGNTCVLNLFSLNVNQYINYVLYLELYSKPDCPLHLVTVKKS